MTDRVRKIVGAWLLLGCIMVCCQVIIGGVTRLTESGLSITQWQPLKGIVPPTSEQEWQEEFSLYKTMTQYKTINQGMEMSEFKWIFFWEYFHRFWARFMGFAFIIPFAFFLVKGWLDKTFFKSLGVLFLWGGLIGVYGWIMVRSGLTGMYVPPVHLSIHLCLALGLYAYLCWMTVLVWRGSEVAAVTSPSNRWLWRSIIVLLFAQIFLGGIVSGMKAGLAYPTWPDMNGSMLPSSLWTDTPSLTGFLTYNAQDAWGRTLIQFIHRGTAYLLVILVITFYWRSRHIVGDSAFRLGRNLLPVTILLQATIGIITVLNCVGHVPVSWGVMHQAGAMLLLANLMFVGYHLRGAAMSSSPK
jgi:heme a synthase